jgi:hypothetical protein
MLSVFASTIHFAKLLDERKMMRSWKETSVPFEGQPHRDASLLPFFSLFQIRFV